MQVKLEIVTFPAFAVLTHTGVTVTFFKTSKELIEKRLENDDSIDLNNQYVNSVVENKESTDSRSRFKDIFDD